MLWPTKRAGKVLRLLKPKLVFLSAEAHSLLRSSQAKVDRFSCDDLIFGHWASACTFSYTS